MKKISKNVQITIILILTALLSAFVLARIASSPQFHAPTIAVLDEKKLDVIELTAATGAASMAISAIPGDATTPIANQITELSSYLLIVVCALFMEKFLLTVTGYLTFAILIPAACILFAVYIHKRAEILKSIAIKLLSFGLSVFMVIPVSVQVSRIIDSTFQLQSTIEQAKKGSEEIEKETRSIEQEEDSESSIKEFFNNVKSSVSGAFSSAMKTAETTFSSFVDAIAALIITSCIIPLAVMFFLLWIVKLIFGINIKFPTLRKPTAKTVS